MAALLPACGASPPTRYHTLQRVDPASVPIAAASAGSSVPVRLEPVTIPAELDRLAIVTRSAPYRVEIADSDRWAAPLDDQIRRVLSDDLATRLPAHRMVDPYEPAGSEPRRQLSVVIAEFYADAACAIELRADWSLSGPLASPDRGIETIQLPGGGCHGSVATAMSAALGQLADRLAAAILAEPATPSER